MNKTLLASAFVPASPLGKIRPARLINSQDQQIPTQYNIAIKAAAL